MTQTPVDFLNLFVRPPGDLLYFLGVIILSQAGLFMAFGQRLRRPQDKGARRYSYAAMGVVITWVLLMVGALVILLSNQNATIILPPLERIANVLTILLLGWAFLTADHARWGRRSDIVLLVLMLAALTGYVITALQWADLPERVDFNLSVWGQLWAFVSVLLALGGILLSVLYFRLIADAPLKLVFFAMLLLGYGGTLYQMSQGQLIGDYAGLSRLVFLAALAIMPMVIYRMIIGSLEASAPPEMSPLAQTKAAFKDTSVPFSPPGAAQLHSPIERESVQLLRTLGLILDEATPSNVPERIVLSVIEVLKVDVGVLLTLQDANYADVRYAYDKPMARTITGMALNLDHQPTLVNAIERQAQRPLYPDRNVEELQDFYTRLDINQVGCVYFQPLIHDERLVAVLAVGLPYSGRELLNSELELLKGIAVISSSLLSLSFAANDARVIAEERAIQAVLQGVSPDDLEDDQVIAARQEMQASLDLARDQIAQLNLQVTELKIQLDDERSRLTVALGDTEQGLSVSQRIAVLNEEHQRLRDERDRLLGRLQEAEAMLAGATSPDNKAVLQKLIEGLQRERDDLLQQRDGLQAQLDEMRANDRALMPQEVQKLLDNMISEKGRLEAERDYLSGKVSDIQMQLKSLGIEGGLSSLTQVVRQVYEQNAALQSQYDQIKRERDALMHERANLESVLQTEKEHETRIQTLQTELLQLAADREAVTKQRDKIRVERDELRAKQEAIKQHRARLLAQVSGYELELKEAHEGQVKLRARIQELADERSDVVKERDRLLAEKQAIETERDQLLARIDGDRERLQQLGADGIGSLTRMIEELSEQRSQLEHELNESRTRQAALENQIEILQVKLSSESEIRTVSSPAYDPENADLVMGLVQELRTPMTSISGYIDLLLGESAGILGEMQRKFLQRVLANVSRLASMLDDLVQVTALDTGKFNLIHEPIDVVALIEDAITSASGQFREKGLTVHLNLEDGLPQLRADRDAVNQIIGQLLTNAYLVSPPDSEVFISAKRKSVNLSSNGSKNKLTDSLYVSVEDRGGGIAAEDEARVFARKYKAENPLIQGLGDTGVGLSIAKALVEAHGGRLWLETRDSVGSIFHFALPLAATVEVEG